MRASTALVAAATTAFFSLSASASDRVRVFDGFGVSIDKMSDAMTDKNSCAMFVQAGPVYLAIDDGSKVVIWPNMDDLHFAFDSEHLLRIGSDKPVALRYMSQRDGLEVTSAGTAKKLIDALSTGKSVHIRYFDWPAHDPRDVSVESPKFSYAWGIAAKECGWHPLSAPTTLPAEELTVAHPLGDDGSTIVSVTGMNDSSGLGLSKSADRYGGGCQITLSSMGILGMFKGRWKTEELLSMGLGKVTVFDKSGGVAFSGKLPGFEAPKGMGGADWPDASKAAKAMWDNAPYGTVSVTGPSTVEKERVPLFGFRPLWQWGQKECGFPSLDSAGDQ